MAAPATADSGTHGPDARTIGLSVGALGVVFGDIGTNPLFAMREAFEGHGHELAVFEDNVLGLLSLMFWSLILVICVKYLAFVMRADNRGEGGILALSALVTPKEPPVRGTRWVILLIGLMGAALLHGDGVITPAISVLAAVEGTTIAAPDLDAVVVPAAVAILVGLFMVQHRGTTAIGRVFGPVMVVWFTTIGVLGLVNVADVRVSSGRSTRVTPSLSSPTTGSVASWCWEPSSWSWWGARPSTPTWVTSAAGPSCSGGTRWCCPACCWSTSVRARS